MYRKAALLLFLINILTSAFAQNKFIRKFEIESTSRLEISGSATAIVFRSTNDLGEYIVLIINGKPIRIPRDPDAPDFTYFKSLDGPLEIRSLQASYKGALHLINTGNAPKVRSYYKENQQACAFELNPILQSDWRAGLPDPSYSRSFSDVKHMIIHHSAGSNTVTDYTQVVRDIYIYHTQSNDWSDIGYNYLIAQNGDLYAGRDPAAGAQDNVIGAHFCGANSTTMGVCLLGNYQEAEATDATWSTLERVAAFKLNKESLDPQSYAAHSLGIVGAIAGHRDGCSTLCPGENVYKRLEALRDSTSKTLVSCGSLDFVLDFSVDRQAITTGESVVFTNNSSGYGSYTWVIEGGDPAETNWPLKGSAIFNNTGSYDITLIGKLDDISDTLVRTELIKVEQTLLLDFTVNRSKLLEGQQVTFDNKSVGYDSYTWYFEGGNPVGTNWPDGGIVTYNYPGLFDVRLIGTYQNTKDTLLLSSSVEVAGELSIFPNPAKPLSDLTVATGGTISKVLITGLDGKNYYISSSSNHEFQIPALRQGLYLLEVYTDLGLEKRKLIVN